MKRCRRSVATSFGEGIGIFARETIPEYILDIIREAHYPSVSEDDLTDEDVYRGLTEEKDFGYQGNLKGSFMEGVQKAAKPARTGNACMRVQQVKIILSAFFHENDWVGELRFEHRWKRGIGRAIFREIMQAIWPEDFRSRILR